MEDKVNNAIANAGDLDTLYTKHRQNGPYPDAYISEIKQDIERVDSIVFVAQKQLDIIVKYFGNDLHSQQRAFEDFGQGVLYDDRRPRSMHRRIHMMDENHRGYRSWYVFNRTEVLLSASSQTKTLDQWLEVACHIGLASAIHFEQHPIQSDPTTGRNPNNPEIDPNILNRLRNMWLTRTFDELDKSFDSNIPSSM
jgi:hypothetical protein